MSLSLSEVSSEIQSQDNGGLEHPLFCVYETQYVKADSDYTYPNGTQHYWVSEDGDEYGEGSDVYNALELVADLFGEAKSKMTIDNTDYNKLEMANMPVFVTACFTRISAERYIMGNKHNLRQPYISVHSLHRNAEMIGIRDFFKGGDHVKD